jgi:hypothetical protein
MQDTTSAPHVDVFDRIVTTAERVGVPIATFALGAAVLLTSPMLAIPVLPWLGAVLVLAALATYVWLTARSTVRVETPTPPLPDEVRELLVWMQEEMRRQNEWARSRAGAAAHLQLGAGVGRGATIDTAPAATVRASDASTA